TSTELFLRIPLIILILECFKLHFLHIATLMYSDALYYIRLSYVLCHIIISLKKKSSKTKPYFQDWDRLHAAFWDMQAYWNMLERKRKQLERQHIGGQALHSTLPQSIKHIQLDLRDLMSQVSNQMSYMRSSWMKPTSPTARAPLSPENRSQTLWDSRVEGYVILRDLDLYLTKLARDFLLLASKTTASDSPLADVLACLWPPSALNPSRNQ
uniref:Ciliary neurotrophic factor n=1 Tax=Sparus aurata TaxID=8175 RepID=A0A671Y470_SPAAU